jgi:NADH-quinone oxidoreductase subunit C
MSIPPYLPSLISSLSALPEGAVQDTVTAHGEVTLIVARERLIEVLTCLRDQLGFEMLADETCVDYFPREPRFGLVYHLNSLSRLMRVRVKVMLSEHDRRAPSVCGVYASANWLEREIYDLFGIAFDGHPDLRRILMPPGWEGHPLLKEHPVKVEEVAFSFNRARIDGAKPYARE